MQNTLTLNPPFSIKQLSLKSFLKSFWILNFALCLSLSVFYVFQMNEIIKGSYSIEQYEKNLSVLSQENDNLKINFSKSKSLDNIEGLAQSLNLEKITEVKYIQILGNQVVAAK